MWLIKKNESFDVVSAIVTYNTKTNMHGLYVGKVDGRSRLIKESKDKKEVMEIKEAIDYAIEHGEKVLRIS